MPLCNVSLTDGATGAALTDDLTSAPDAMRCPAPDLSMMYNDKGPCRRLAAGALAVRNHELHVVVVCVCVIDRCA